MKRTKRIFAIFMTMALAMSMLIVSSAVSFADGDTTPTTYTITINKDGTDKAAHTYGAYQVFKGDLKEESSGTATTKTLSNIQWGDNIDSDKVGTLIADLNTALALTGDNAIKSTATAADVAKAISGANVGNNSAKAQAVAAAFEKALKGDPKGTGSVAADAQSGEIKNLPAGYYLVKDTAAVTGEGASTRYILQVVSNVEVTEKASVPSVVKKVQDVNDSKATSTTDPKNPTDWQDSADYDIGDDVPFQLTATTASTANDYVKYHVTFQDTQSEGLDKPSSFNVSVLGQTIALSSNAVGTEGTASTASTNITAKVVAPEEGKTFAIKVSFESKTEGAKLTDVASTPIVVTYSSKLNDKAKLGSTGNPNEVYLKYSNNPNKTDDSEEGKTPEDKVIVFTYKVVVNKVDQNKQPLVGASFKLSKKNAEGKYEEIRTIDGTNLSTFEWTGVDDGDYKLEETATPSGYNTIDPIEFTVSAEHTVIGDNPTLTKLEGGDKFTGEVSTGQLKAQIVNEKGATLPSTGGIGTIIFYVLGSLLVVGCGIVLISKRRMESR